MTRVNQEGTVELIQLVGLHLPSSAKGARSLYKLKQMFAEMFDDMQADSHHYCSACYSPLDAGERCSDSRCGGARVGRFVSVPIAAQLKHKVEGMYM